MYVKALPFRNISHPGINQHPVVHNGILENMFYSVTIPFHQHTLLSQVTKVILFYYVRTVMKKGDVECMSNTT